MLRLRLLVLASLLAANPLARVFAAEDWSLCRVPAFVYAPPEDLASDETLIEAQTIASENSEQIHFVGDVAVSRAEEIIRADELYLDKQTRQLRARGDVLFESPRYRLHSPSILIDDEREQARFDAPEFELRDRHGRGQAARIERLDASRSRFDDLVYTACDPGDRDWHLAASELEIDDATGRGTAKHARLYFQEIPFFYLPWFQFPIDDRRMSGLLAPRFGYADSQGAQFALPVYLNLAPNYDMTVTPDYYGERGLQLNTENRYLFASSQGRLDLSYLDDDEFGDTRYFQEWHHFARLDRRWQADLTLADVSDGEFFDDFDNVASRYNSISHLERHARVARRGEVWNGELLWQDYRTLDETTAAVDRPYNRLPRLAADGDFDFADDRLATPLRAEWVNFERDDSVTGERTHLVASLRWTAEQSWYYAKPDLQLALTDYRLDDSDGDEEIDRALPTLSIDTALRFERLAGTDAQWLQTLEPRLYFLHTPFEDQDDIPDFDTSLLSATYDNFFRNNRFSGSDRIGDASQVTVGIATRVFGNDSGNELMHARVGQIHYYKDRRVSLDGSRDDASHSDLIAELDLRPDPRLTVTTRLVRDEASGEIDDRDFAINYSANGLAANLGYYFTEDELEQALVSVVYPLNERWTLFAKYHESLLFDRPVDHLLGFAYESCCWGIKILAGQSGDESDDFAETDERIYFEITLKGLSAAGRDIDAQLTDAIPGYRPRF